MKQDAKDVPTESTVSLQGLYHPNERNAQSWRCCDLWIPGRPLAPAIRLCLRDVERFVLSIINTVANLPTGQPHHVRFDNLIVEFLQQGDRNNTVDKERDSRFWQHLLQQTWANRTQTWRQCCVDGEAMKSWRM